LIEKKSRNSDFFSPTSLIALEGVQSGKGQ
jgi:hypothetical protein